MHKKLPAITEEEDVKAIVIMLRALASEARLHLLKSLYEHPKTWTELVLELKVNPKVLRDNLAYLRKSNLVQRKNPVGFELTEAGRAVMELSLREILEASREIA